MDNKNEALEQSIKSAVENICPDNFDSILEKCEKSEGVVIPMKNNKWKKIVAIAAAFVIVFAGTFGFISMKSAKKAYTTVSLDVNPSVSFDLNKAGKVVDFSALNLDGETILGGMDLTGLDSETAVNALVGSMLTNGYLSDIQNTILVSVQSQKDSVAEEIQNNISTQISGMLENLSSGGNVLSQVISSSTDLTSFESLAEEYGISVGKSLFIDKIVNSTEGLDFADLATKTINEIAVIAEVKGSEIIADVANTAIESIGTASIEKYIDEATAQLIAVASENIKSLDVKGLEITKSDFTYNNGALCYDIGFTYKNEAFLIEVDASTGVIIDKQSGKIGVELEINNFNVDTGNEVIDNTINNTVNGTKVKAEVDTPDVNINNDGDNSVKTTVVVGDVEIPVEVEIPAELITSIKNTAKSTAKDVLIPTILKTVGLGESSPLYTFAVSQLGTLIDEAIDNATVETTTKDDQKCYKIDATITVPILGNQAGFTLYFDTTGNFMDFDLNIA